MKRPINILMDIIGSIWNFVIIDVLEWYKQFSLKLYKTKIKSSVNKCDPIAKIHEINIRMITNFRKYSISPSRQNRDELKNSYCNCKFILIGGHLFIRATELGEFRRVAKAHFRANSWQACESFTGTAIRFSGNRQP